VPIPHAINAEGFEALAFVRAGCSTTAMLGAAMGCNLSCAGHLMLMLRHFGAIRQCGRLQNGSNVFECVPEWVAPPPPSPPPVQVLTPFDQWLRRGVTLPSGHARVITS